MFVVTGDQLSAQFQWTPSDNDRRPPSAAGRQRNNRQMSSLLSAFLSMQMRTKLVDASRYETAKVAQRRFFCMKNCDTS